MTTTIALAGKGGVGKTTISAMVIKYLAQTQPGAVLAIDADPSSNLNMVLGLELDWTVGDIREDMLMQVKDSLLGSGAAMGALPGGTSKRDYLDYHIRSSLAEGGKFDLIAMGRGEGQGCYCAVNHNLREVIDALSKNYTYVVIDNEAGMEHLSRRTTNNVDTLCIVAEPTSVGALTAQRIFNLARKLPIVVKRIGVVWSRTSQGRELDGIEVLGSIPYDQAVSDASMQGKTVFDIQDDSPAFVAARKILAEMMVSNS